MEMGDQTAAIFEKSDVYNGSDLPWDSQCPVAWPLVQPRIAHLTNVPPPHLPSSMPTQHTQDTELSLPWKAHRGIQEGNMSPEG